MNIIRALIRKDPLLAATIVAMALCMKMFVPAGYMIDRDGANELTVSICSGIDTFVSTTVSLPSNGSEGHDQHDARHMPCAFTALAMAALGGADAPLLALALSFILLVGLLPVRQIVSGRSAYRRPPSRAPPVFS